MEKMRFKPKFDRLYWLITIPTSLFILAAIVMCAIVGEGLIIMIPVSALTFYFLFIPFFTYAELTDEGLYIKYGAFIKRTIPYKSIRKIEKGRGIIGEAMLSMKNALDHVTVRYNRFDMTVLSLKSEDIFVKELWERVQLSFSQEKS